MARSDCVEVPTIEGCDFGDAEPLGNCDDRSVRGAEREVGIGFDELGHSP